MAGPRCPKLLRVGEEPPSFEQSHFRDYFTGTLQKAGRLARPAKNRLAAVKQIRQTTPRAEGVNARMARLKGLKTTKPIIFLERGTLFFEKLA